MYDESVRDDICALIASGRSLRSICREGGMPGMSVVMAWLNEDKAFSEHYARAMEARADAKFDELDDVSADAESAESPVKIAGLRLKADNIKWQLARMSPRKYGDKLDLNHSGAVKHDHTLGLSAATSELLGTLRAGSGDPGNAAPVQD